MMMGARTTVKINWIHSVVLTLSKLQPVLRRVLWVSFPDRLWSVDTRAQSSNKPEGPVHMKSMVSNGEFGPVAHLTMLFPHDSVATFADFESDPL